jgi:hypothetical protein
LKQFAVSDTFSHRAKATVLMRNPSRTKRFAMTQWLDDFLYPCNFASMLRQLNGRASAKKSMVFRVFTWIIILAAFVFPKSDRACVMRDGIPSLQYEQRSDAYQGAVLWLSNESGGIRFWDGSAVRLNEWYGLAAAHLFLGPGYSNLNAHVGTGTNFMTDRGVTRNITSVLIIPGYDPNAAPATVPDVAILKFDHPLPGPDLTIGTINDGDVVTTAGFGSYGYPATQYILTDGNRRAFDAPKSTDTNYPGIIYDLDWDELTGPLYGGMAAPGDSGSPGFNSAGQLVAIADAVDPTVNGQAGAGTNATTYSIRLDAFADWIQTNTVVATPNLSASLQGTNLIVSWIGSYTLQTSPHANGSFVSIPGASSPYTNAITGIDSRFFRLALPPDPPPLPPTTDTNLGTLGATADGVDFYVAHGLPGAIAGDSSDFAIGLPAAPDADGGIFRVPFQTALNPSGPFSIELWTKPAQTVSSAVLASSIFHPSPVGQRGGWYLYQGDTSGGANGFYFGCYNTSGDSTVTQASLNSAIDTNAWYFLTGVFDGTNANLYVNGVSVANSALPAGQSFRANPSAPMTFGARSDYVAWFYGDLDQPAFYTNGLSPAQVLTHFQAGTNASPPITYQQVILNDDPAGYWRFAPAGATNQMSVEPLVARKKILPHPATSSQKYPTQPHSRGTNAPIYLRSLNE